MSYIRCKCGQKIAMIDTGEPPCPQVSDMSSGYQAVHCTTWGRAMELCQNIGLNLPVPRSAEENEQIRGLSGGLHWRWLGIRFDGAWADFDGNPLNYHNWSENCVINDPHKTAVFMDKDGFWCTLSPSNDRNALCI